MYALFHVFLLFFILVAGNNSVQWSFFLYVQMSVRQAFQFSQPDALCASLAGVRTEIECKITIFFLSTNFFNAFLLRNVVFFDFLGFYFFKNVRFIVKKCCPTW